MSTSKLNLLTPRLAINFGTIKAQRKRFEKMEDDLAEVVRPLMRVSDKDIQVRTEQGTNGVVVTRQYTPKTSPFMIEFSEFKTIDISWPVEFRNLYIKTYGEAAYEAYMRALPLKDSTKLDVKLNPNYQPTAKEEKPAETAPALEVQVGS